MGVSLMIMERILVPYILFVAGCTASKYAVLHSPDSVQFLTTDSRLQTHEVPNLIVSSFGYATAVDLKWSGLSAGNPFKRPKAHVLISVPITSDLPCAAEAKCYEAENDVGKFTTEAVGGYLQAVNENPLVLDFSDETAALDETYPWLFKGMPTTFNKLREALASFTQLQPKSLSLEDKTHMKFLARLLLTKTVMKQVSEWREMIDDASPDFIHFTIPGLLDITELSGQDSSEATEAVHLVQTVVEEITNTFRELYKDNVVIELLTYRPLAPEQEPKHMRQLLAAQTQASANGTIADQIKVYQPWYSDSLAEVFNVVFWGMIIFALAIFAVSYSIWTMDPGRDSIIYRMTSQRLKKDQ